MTQHITVVAQGGLCNRLRVVLSALCFSEETGCFVRVEWAKNAWKDILKYVCCPQ